MLDQVVKCEGVKNGCEWEGEIRSLDQHKSTCLHVPVPCPRECDVGSVLRGDLQSHLRDYCSQRDYECPHCLQMGRYSDIQATHIDMEGCPMVPTKCPNEGCEEVVSRGNIEAHLDKDCKLTICQCRYSEAGCKVELPRRDLKEHEDDLKLHLQVVMKYSKTTTDSLQKAVDKLTTDNAYLLNKLRELSATNSVLQKKLNGDFMTFKVTEYQRMREENKFYLPPVYISPEGYQMKFIVKVGLGMLNHISVTFLLVKGRDDHKLKWPFVGEVTVTLLNQLRDDAHHTQTLVIKPEDDFQTGKELGFQKFTRHSALGQHSYLKDDTLYFRVSSRTQDHTPWLD